MEIIISALGPYGIIINLIPGILFYLLAPLEFQSTVNIDNSIFLFVFCYFIGLILNRIGSLIISPMAQIVGFIKYAPYDQFLQAEEVEKSRAEHKLQTLVTVNNFYGSITKSVG